MIFVDRSNKRKKNLIVKSLLFVTLVVLKYKNVREGNTQRPITQRDKGWIICPCLDVLEMTEC